MSDRPSWLYKKPKYFHDNFYTKFQIELLSVLKNIVGDPTDEKNINTLVSEPDYNKVKSLCPFLTNYFKIIKLDHLSITPCFLITKNLSKKIHIDYPSSGFALNIPILNCENTYTVWYDAKDVLSTAAIYSTKSWEEPSKSPIFDETTAVEIDRIDSNISYWVNIMVPHAAVYNHDKIRINASLRFDERIKEYLLSSYGKI